MTERTAAPVLRALGESLLADPQIQALLRDLIRRAILASVQAAVANLDKDGDGVPDLAGLYTPTPTPGAKVD